MAKCDRTRWDQRYLDQKWLRDKDPAALLIEAADRSGGMALDVACGTGQNTRWLAAHGYRVIGVDISRRGLQIAQRRLRQRPMALDVLLVQADLDNFWLPAECFNLICIFRFLDRRLFDNLQAALVPGGQLIYETLNWRWAQTHPDAPSDYLLKPGELRHAFHRLEITLHCEERAFTQLVARKTAG